PPADQVCCGRRKENFREAQSRGKVSVPQVELTADLDSLMTSLGHYFGDQELLIRALTHESLAFEQVGADAGPGCDNDKLEFLGDSILGFLVSEELVRRYPHLPEGQLSKLKAHLVSAHHLHTVAQDLAIGTHIILGRGEEMSGGREKKAILSNAIE